MSTEEITSTYLEDIPLHPTMDVSYIMHDHEAADINCPGSAPRIELTAIVVDFGGQKLMLGPESLSIHDHDRIEEAIQDDVIEWWDLENHAYLDSLLNIRPL